VEIKMNNQFDVEKILEKVEELLVDTLRSYQEVIINCQLEEGDGESSFAFANSSVMYDETDSELPIFTTSERLVEEFMEEFSDFLRYHLHQVGEPDEEDQ
jgi:Fic family protein